MLEPLLKHNQYIKSHPIQNQFLFSNYYKLFQIFSTVTHQSHIKKKKKECTNMQNSLEIVWKFNCTLRTQITLKPSTKY